MRAKSNRRKAESVGPRWRLPSIHVDWRAVFLPPLALGVAAASLAVAKILLDQPVRTLVIEGPFQRVTPIDIEAAVADALHGGFLSVDLRTLRERVAELAWVDDVRIGRRWPDTVTVHVREHQAAAHWGERGLLNVRGEIFTDEAPHELPELPRLAGPVGSEHDVAVRYLAVRGALVEADLTLESLTMDERGSWRLELGSGQVIRLGRQDVDERLRRFFDVVAPALANDLQRVKYVDMRYTNGFAVGWLPASDAALASARPVPQGG